MPNRNIKFRDRGASNRGTLTAAGRFRPNGASQPDNTLNVGGPFTATWISTGTFDLKIDVPARRVLAVTTQLMLGALSNRRVEIRSMTQGVDGAWTIRLVVTDLTNTTPVVQDIASGVDNWIHVNAELQLVAP
jgi:hypothetical protein